MSADEAITAYKNASDRFGNKTARFVYVCHAYTGGLGIKANVNQVRAICVAIAAQGDVPIAPQLTLPAALDERTERDRAMEACLRLIDTCDEVQAHGDYLTNGMLQELAYAAQKGKKITGFGRLALSAGVAQDPEAVNGIGGDSVSSTYRVDRISR